MTQYSKTNHYNSVRDGILNGIKQISEPVKSTLTPKGSNILYKDSVGRFIATNDGVTITEQIQPENEIENTIVQIIKQAALQTNAIAGDGTSTSVMLSETLLLEGLKLIEDGYNPIRLSNDIQSCANDILKNIELLKKNIDTEEQLHYVASVSSSNNKEITDNVVKAILSAGDDGIVMMDTSNTNDTEVISESGYRLDDGMFSSAFVNVKGKGIAQYNDVKVLVTDKRIYYPQEALAIMNAIVKAGLNEVVVIARDFIGQAPNVFITNHVNNKIKVLLVKESTATDKNIDTLEDIATYLGTQVVSDKKGQLTFDVKIEDFGTADVIISDGQKTIIKAQENEKSIDRINELKELLKEDKDNELLKKRLSRMTSGTTIVKVGGGTPIEVREKMFKYEDAVNATRSAKKDGYVVGGGLTLYKAFAMLDTSRYNKDVVSLFEKVCTTPLKQIAINCDLRYKTLLSKVGEGLGYNANTEQYSDLEQDGIIEPYIVATTSFNSAVSVARTILSSKFIITNYVK